MNRRFLAGWGAGSLICNLSNLSADGQNRPVGYEPVKITANKMRCQYRQQRRDRLLWSVPSFVCCTDLDARPRQGKRGLRGRLCRLIPENSGEAKKKSYENGIDSWMKTYYNKLYCETIAAISFSGSSVLER